MNWDEQISSIKLGTLFKFFGKSMVASILWVVIWYVILMLPMLGFVYIMTNFMLPR
ncbi:hypothetical protein ACFLXF_05015 [Chloroflexota bacterium]